MSFPGESMKNNLMLLAVGRCNLLSLPAHTSNFEKLIYLDARDNNITNVDAKLLSLIKKNDMEVFFLLVMMKHVTIRKN